MNADTLIADAVSCSRPSLAAEADAHRGAYVDQPSGPAVAVSRDLAATPPPRTDAGWYAAGLAALFVTTPPRRDASPRT